LLRELTPRVLPRLAAWARRTVEALPANEANAPGFRDLYPNAGQFAQWLDLYPSKHASAHGPFVWTNPRSNVSERIQAYLALGRMLNDPGYHRLAIRYADAMAGDPVRGIYQGEEEDGRGLVWYWNDSGVYSTIYAMRAPSAFLALAEATRRQKYRDIALLCGQQLLRSIQPTGILREGWVPCSSPVYEKFARELARNKINSRIGYVTLAFVELYRATGDEAYRQGLARFLKALEQYQNADGSFPTSFRTDRIEPVGPPKGHFLYYTIDGIAKAACLMPEEPALRRIAERLGRHLVQQYRRTWSLLYGNVDADSPPEASEWRVASAQPAYGLIWLTKLTGDSAYREVACRLLLEAMLSTFDCPDNPDLHGAIPNWLRPDLDPLPSIGGIQHFWTILAVEALDTVVTA